MIFGCKGEKGSSAATKAGTVDFVSSDFSPAHPRTIDPVTVNPNLVTGGNVEFKWMVNDILQEVDNARLSPDHFSKGDTILCLILIDGKERKKVGPVVIENTKPEIVRVQIEPREPRNGEALSVQGDVRDPDEKDNISFLVEWFINGENAFSGEKLPGDKIKAGNEIYAEVEPFDGFEKGPKVQTEKIAVQNAPPEIILGSPQVKDRLMNYEIEIKDMDGDKVDLTLESAPSGMRLEGNRLIWEVPEGSKDTSVLINIKARDERGGETSNSFNLDLRRSEMQ